MIAIRDRSRPTSGSAADWSYHVLVVSPACHRHFEASATASCPGFWSCQARAGCNGHAVLLFVSALRVPAAALSPAFGPP